MGCTGSTSPPPLSPMLKSKDTPYPQQAPQPQRHNGMIIAPALVPGPTVYRYHNPQTAEVVSSLLPPDVSIRFPNILPHAHYPLAPRDGMPSTRSHHQDQLRYPRYARCRILVPTRYWSLLARQAHQVREVWTTD